MLVSTRTAITVSLAALACTLTVSVAGAAETTLRNPLVSGDTFAVRAIDGSIDVVRGTGPATVVATATTPDGVSPDMHMAESRTDGRWTVCAVALSKTDCDGHVRIENVRTRIDFRVTLPGGVNFEARDVSGKITVRNAASDVDAKSVSGDVRVTTSGSARVQTVSGQVDVTIGRVSESIAFDSVSGDVHLALPRGANASLNAKSVSGDVSGGAGVTFSGDSGFVGHNVDATIGRGGTAIGIKTVSGSIFVKTQ